MNTNDIMEEFSNSQGDNASLYRNRPYRGQSHTAQGDRGKQEIKGITMRDLCDAFIIGACSASGHLLNSELYDKVESRRLNRNDLYRLNWNELDPGAVCNQMCCEIEKMMGIFPNVPKENQDD